MSATGPATGHLPARGAARWELLRALGAYCAEPGAASGPLGEALGLTTMTPAEHTQVFVLDLPPYASIHLGATGQLGGEPAELVAGMWRALGLTPPADADHLAGLLGLYAELGGAAGGCRSTAARARLDHARSVLLGEHLASWLPGYLAAVARYPAAATWADLTAAALRAEVVTDPPPDVLPSALAGAPEPPGVDAGDDELLDALVAPVRSGLVITHRDLLAAGRATGVGVRRGERRFVLASMLSQDPGALLDWLASEAAWWSAPERRAIPACPTTSTWWARRAAASAAVLGRRAGTLGRRAGTLVGTVPEP